MKSVTSVLSRASELEIEQLKITLTRRIDNWRWDPRVKKGWWDGKISYFHRDMYVPAGLWEVVKDNVLLCQNVVKTFFVLTRKKKKRKKRKRKSRLSLSI